MTTFEPELGQFFSNQDFQEFEAPELLIAVLEYVAGEIVRVQWNITQKPHELITGNYGEQFECDTFSMRSFCWCDGGIHEDGCPPNFAWKDLIVNWYKHVSRGTSCNRLVTPDDCAKILTECLAAVRALEEE